MTCTRWIHYIAAFALVSGSLIAMEQNNAVTTSEIGTNLEFAKSKYLIPTSADAIKELSNEQFEDMLAYITAGQSLSIEQSLMTAFIKNRPTIIVAPTNNESVPNADKSRGIKLVGSSTVCGDYSKELKLSIDTISAQIQGDEVIVKITPRRGPKEKKEDKEWKISSTGTPPTAIALDFPTRTLYVGTKNGSLYRYSLDTQQEVSPCITAHENQISDIRFLGGKYFVTKETRDKESTLKIWTIGDTTCRVSLADIDHANDYVFPGAVVRSHCAETWLDGILPYNSRDATYELPLNYLSGNEFAKPAVIYAVLLQRLMVQKKATQQSKDLVHALVGATARTMLEPAVNSAFEACLNEQATRLGHSLMPRSIFGNENKSDVSEK